MSIRRRKRDMGAAAAGKDSEDAQQDHGQVPDSDPDAADAHSGAASSSSNGQGAASTASAEAPQPVEGPPEESIKKVLERARNNNAEVFERAKASAGDAGDHKPAV
eukprot:754137-Pyramimonas_sp.AAC.1